MRPEKQKGKRRDPEQISVREASAMLRLHADTVRRLLRHGRLPGRKVDGRWRLFKNSLRAYFDVGHMLGPASTRGRQR